MCNKFLQQSLFLSLHASVLSFFAVFAGDITVRVMYSNYLYMRLNSILRVSLLATLFQSGAQAQKPVGNFLYEFCDFFRHREFSIFNGI